MVFEKINSPFKIFANVDLASYPTALSPRRLRQGGQRGTRTLPPSGTAAGPNRHATRRQGLFLNTFNFLKMTN
jgi:hypothetical protein